MAETRITESGEQAKLRRYFPSYLWERWQDGNTADGLRHLQAVLQAVVTYLPHRVARTRRPEPALPTVSGVFVQATLLFADISGFTAMSERLTQLGREGAEVIASIVNDYFAAMLEIIARYNGDLLKFGGDALLVYFDDDGCAARGCLTALEMQRTMNRFAVIKTAQGTFNLHMTAGLGTGTLFLANLGSLDRVEFAVMGPALELMARAEDLAQAGDVIVDQTTYDHVSSYATVSKREPGFYHLLDLARPSLHREPEPPLSASVDARGLVERLDALTPYLPPGVLERIVASPAQRMIEGEHRLVTVLFANFYGINPLIDSLGTDQADELTGILNRHFTTMRDIIHRYGGIVNKIDSYVIGYRIMALFGAPIAHEDDPARAVRAALEMQQAMGRFVDLATSAGAFSLKQRIGVNTGYVFAGNFGSDLRQEYSVMGDEVNLTSRLMGVATEGEVLVSHSTARHIEALFELHERAPVKVKGKSHPVRNYRVGQRFTEGELAASVGEFVGRREELETARELVNRVLAGNGVILDVSGSRGIGKTRLTQELCAYASERGMTVLQSAARSYGQSIPYFPWIAILRSLLGLGEDEESPDRRRERIFAGLRQADATDWAPIVGEVLSVEIKENALTASLDAKMRQQRFFDVVLQVLQARAERSPLVLALDDMHWADAVSLDLTTYVAGNASGSPLLLTVVHRPDLQTVPWSKAQGFHELQLDELDDQASLDLAHSILDSASLSRSTEMALSVRHLLLERTQGNPLFVQEITRALVESGGIRLEDTAQEKQTWVIADDACCAEVPTTLAGLIMSRIDRLEMTDRRLLQVSSVIGISFRPPVLTRVYPYDDLNGTLNSRLGRLAQLDFLSLAPPDEYAFKHTLTHEVAYESLPFARRRTLHVRVGGDIERQFADDLTEHYGVLAHHFERGQVLDKAFNYLTQAGHRARSEYANEAALDYYQRTLAVGINQEVLPSETKGQILEIREAMGDVYLLVSQYKQAIQQFEEALTHPMCTPRRSSDLLRKIAQAHELQGQYDEALRHLDGGRWVLSWEDEDRHSAEMARICEAFGYVYMRRGEVEQAIQECERGLSIMTRLAHDTAALSIEAYLYNTLGIVYADLQGDYAEAAKAWQRSTDLREQTGDLPGLTRSYNNLARVSWVQGNPEEAGDYIRRSLEISRRIGDNHMVALAYNNLGAISFAIGDAEQALAHYQEALALRQRIGDSHGIAEVCSNIGEALTSLERHDQARPYLERAAATFEAIQSEGELPEVYWLLAEVELARGNAVPALGRAEQARHIAAKLGSLDKQGIAERVIARCHAQAGNVAQTTRSFEASIGLLETSGHQVELARSHSQFGRWLRTQVGQRDPARAHLQRAADLFAAAGNEKEAAQARAALKECGT
jgi:class 3 adenylate cyclase/predicted ATPase